MSQSKRIILAVGLIIVLIGVVLGLESLRAKIIAKEQDVTLNPGDVPVYKDGELLAAINSADLADLQWCNSLMQNRARSRRAG